MACSRRRRLISFEGSSAQSAMEDLTPTCESWSSRLTGLRGLFGFGLTPSFTMEVPSMRSRSSNRWNARSAALTAISHRASDISAIEAIRAVPTVVLHLGQRSTLLLDELDRPNHRSSMQTAALRNRAVSSRPLRPASEVVMTAVHRVLSRQPHIDQNRLEGLPGGPDGLGRNDARRSRFSLRGRARSS